MKTKFSLKRLIMCSAVCLAVFLGYYGSTQLYQKITNAGDECTSWVAQGSAAPVGKNIVHKNRDKSSDEAQVVGRNKEGIPFLGIGFASDVDANNNLQKVSAGINKAGLAVAYNAACCGYIWGKVTARTMLTTILKNQSSVDNAYLYLKNNVTKLSEGGIFFFGDRYKTMIVEVSGGYSKKIDVVNDAKARSNYFVSLMYSDPQMTTEIYRRYDTARDFLNANKSDRISILEDFELSRLYYGNTGIEESDNDVENHDYLGSICNSNTVNATAFVIDVNDPKNRSCMWVAIGRPDLSIYIPIHIGNALAQNTDGTFKYKNGDPVNPDYTDSRLYDPNNSLFAVTQDIYKIMIQNWTSANDKRYTLLQTESQVILDATALESSGASDDQLNTFDRMQADALIEALKDIYGIQ